MNNNFEQQHQDTYGPDCRLLVGNLPCDIPHFILEEIVKWIFLWHGTCSIHVTQSRDSRRSAFVQFETRLAAHFAWSAACHGFLSLAGRRLRAQWAQGTALNPRTITENPPLIYPREVAYFGVRRDPGDGRMGYPFMGPQPPEPDIWHPGFFFYITTVYQA
ncbi:hypothetical protein FE257_008702 [Aspergillus nanangensis]|uniref:RRM domain-containing protein n=1 Tax=Aspergillus nanangensis TaxID=2582783 RepID=A0AAD4CKY6_ASPNN|nr:hypothetical protein FE257_008702 [Aspergillus nanangensis]